MMSEQVQAEEIEQLSFEEALTRLEEIVEMMDSGDLQLQGAIEQFEIAMRLKNHCEAQLAKAEATIEELVEENTPTHEADSGE
jgi:exodeoxyribonuclease VII small subunit